MDYYIYKNDQNIGPLSEGDISGGLKSGRFSAKDLACRVGEDKWQDLEIFFPQVTHSWMENSDTSQSSSYNPPTQTIPNPNYGGNRQTGFQSPVQAYAQPVQVQHVVHHYEEKPESSLPKIALIGAIVVACLMVVGLVPCLGWLNWIVIPLAVVMKAVCWVAILTERNTKGRNKALIGLILVALTLIISGIRLAVGGGCL
jgi:amino acid transporter